jgi:hypothetical protein
MLHAGSRRLCSETAVSSRAYPITPEISFVREILKHNIVAAIGR